jgi:hypothetical protein
MKTLKFGEQFILKLEDGEGLFYSITGSFTHPFEMIKTLTKDEVKKLETE